MAEEVQTKKMHFFEKKSQNVLVVCRIVVPLHSQNSTEKR